MHYPFPVRPQVWDAQAPAWKTCTALQAALYYATRLGWPVFPVVPAGKRPLVARGFYSATVNVERIRAWWQRWPRANIGVPTGRSTGLVVLDVDAKADPEVGRNGYDSLDRLALVRGYEPLPPTRLAATGGGGLHLFYAYPAGAQVSSTTRLRGLPGLDVRAEGSYIVCPPSQHASGRRYRWIDEGPLAPYPTFLVELAIAPLWRGDRGLRHYRGPAVRQWDRVAMRVARTRARPGNRNGVGYWLARRLVEAGLPLAEAENVMRVYARFVPVGHHPYTVEEALASLHSVSRQYAPGTLPSKKRRTGPGGKE
jgi:hypothetical protein